MPEITDQTGRLIKLPELPRRIVSLVPSQTELLYALGLDEEVKGITRFCVHPEKWFRTKKRIGGTKNVHISEVAALQPDLIIANKEENIREQVEALQELAPVMVTDVNDLTTATEMIIQVGRITGREDKALALATEIRRQFEQLTPVQPAIRTAYLIWRNPYMTVGADTFINDILSRAGFINVFADKTRYPAVTIEEMKTADPELILLSSEPYPFRDKHIAELQQDLPHTHILLADGEMFSWYGSRISQFPAYFCRLSAGLNALKS
ncbi:ABC transporter substrate-binding protein [Sediminibacterium ginsengisoli]|uniref:ABC-type Fe3+-hydroxamate transport system, substrate-binding protein n=1 Tax=Sediminibacterium ginsengisoli TaxID=413434 RepID=A0A1T4LIN3_9BACT|nr:helical backbone metal receptor [Sediminibacterium ginsengisoli]SJZ54427.1 ABC-type Fe3+-hydroxamate transport system, substrate-binding protein [Sediminibacterium ginsengisoli]